MKKNKEDGGNEEEEKGGEKHVRHIIHSLGSTKCFTVHVRVNLEFRDTLKGEGAGNRTTDLPVGG